MEEQELQFEQNVVYDSSVCKQVYAEAMMVTPEIAEQFLTKNTLNRRLDISRVTCYVKCIRAGAWVLNGEGIVFDNEGTLINGQHRLAAVIKSGIAVPFLVVRGVPKKSFLVTDSGKNRTLGDIFGINGAQNSAVASSGVNTYLIMRAGGFINVKCRNASNNIPREKVIKFYNDNKEKVDDVAKYCISLGKKFIYKEPALFVSIYLYLFFEKKYPDDTIRQFFDWYADPTSCKCTSIYNLRDKFTRAKAKKVAIQISYKYRLYIKTWNNYIQGKWNTQLRLLDNEVVEFK